MSAAGRGGVRREADYYPTPAWCVRRILEALPSLPVGGHWLEPSAGDGAILRAVQEHYGTIGHVTAVEIRRECRAALADVADDVLIRDFLAMPVEDLQSQKFDIAILNPPYSLALEFVRRCLAVARGVVCLTRLNWLGAQERNEFLRCYTPDVYVLSDRPSFTGDGSTDATEYAWLVWPPGGRRGARARLEVLPLTARSEKDEDARQLALPGVDGRGDERQVSLFGDAG